MFQRSRSALYLPASNERALAKAPTLACDLAILDLEDAVSPAHKEAARAAAREAVAAGFSGKPVMVRLNAPDTEFFAADVAAFADSPVALLLPKVSNPQTLAQAAHALPGVPLFAMIESCEAILNVGDIAAASRELPLAGLVVGTNDLAEEMGCRLARSRRPVWSALSAVVIAARAHGLMALDGVYNDIADADGLADECEEGREFGFDGKTLIHPSQIEACNRAFSPSETELAFARAVVETFEQAANANANALKIEGRMVERLHLAGARRTLARGD